jgi:hypothetical protein
LAPLPLENFGAKVNGVSNEVIGADHGGIDFNDGKVLSDAVLTGAEN